MESNCIELPFNDFCNFIRIAQKEVIQRLNLKLQPGYPDYPGYYFVKKNSNRYFRKHLGFMTTRSKRLYYGKIIVNDYKKLLLFRLKYNI